MCGCSVQALCAAFAIGLVFAIWATGSAIQTGQLGSKRWVQLIKAAALQAAALCPSFPSLCRGRWAHVFVVDLAWFLYGLGSLYKGHVKTSVFKTCL